MDFRVIGRRRHYYPDNGEDALVMRKELVSG
jgi:ribosomal protein S18 acetylase RimI-like enzyme